MVRALERKNAALAFVSQAIQRELDAEITRGTITAEDRDAEYERRVQEFQSKHLKQISVRPTFFPLLEKFYARMQKSAERQIESGELTRAEGDAQFNERKSQLNQFVFIFFNRASSLGVGQQSTASLSSLYGSAKADKVDEVPAPISVKDFFKFLDQEQLALRSIMSAPKYFLYARKSTEDDDKQVMSIEAQLYELREFARRENLEILKEFQESKSAKKPGREVFNEMMQLIERDGANGIVSWHPDRLARNSVDGGKIIYLVDTQKIVSLRFPTFWCEPTPQGLFMLQVAFGQSKYYSDNLKQNVERGIRQKLRRGEWLTKAPFGYVNNPRTRNIEPDAVKSKVIGRAYAEYAKGGRTLVSMAQFLAEHGVAQRNGTPLVKASVKRLLSNRAYLGLVKHRGEYFPGSFKPILSLTLFESVQKRLQERAHPRHLKHSHNFPFAGLFRCGECESMITAQWATGKCGGRYRYYRCTKKSGRCTQRYLQEDALASQIKERLQSVSLPDAWTEDMLKQVAKWEHEEVHASGTRVEQVREQVKSVEVKLDSLVDLYLNHDVERDIYLAKKDKLMREKLSLQEKFSSARHERKNWVEPLRKWILDSKRAGFLASSTNYGEIREFVRSFGTNPAMHNKTISISFCPPSQFVSARETNSHFAHPLLAAARKRAAAFSDRVSDCAGTGNRTPI